MILKIYAVHDNAVKAYLPPLFFRSDGEAVRSFTDAVNAENSGFRAHAGDYNFFYLGEYDDQLGAFTCVVPERVVSALQVLVENPGVLPLPDRVPPSPDRMAATGFGRLNGR